jgi:hypothetical protein
MQPRLSLVVLAALGFTTTALAADPSEKDRAERLAKLIQQIGSEQHVDREAASKALEELGAPALDCLKKACAAEDAEVRHRAEQALRSIERRIETERLLTPRRIKLTYRDTPLSDAIADLSKKSRVPITLEGDGNRKITVETSETSFWDALAQFCDKAGVIERQNGTLRADNNMNERQILLQQQVMILKMQRGGYRRGGAPAATAIVLTNGKSQPAPTCITGALRIRALPGESRMMVQPNNDRDAIFSLEVTSEPGMELLRVLAPRITRAEDDKGTALRCMPPPDEPAGNMYEEMIIVNQDIAGVTPGASASCTTARTRLRDPSAKQLNVLCGSMVVEVRTSPGPLVTVEDIGKAAGKSFESADGGRLKVTEVKHTDAELTVKVSVDVPNMMGPRNFAWAMARGRRLGIEPQVAASDDTVGLSLYDASGKRFPGLVKMEDVVAPGAANILNDYTLTYKLEKGQQPTRLVLTGRRNVFIDVPFALKDVPLPGK